MSNKQDYEYYIALAWELSYSYQKYKEFKELWLTDEDIMIKKKDMITTPRKHDIMYIDYVEICSILEYTPFSESTFCKKFNESDFWSRHQKIVLSDIKFKWEDCLTKLDLRYIRNLWVIFKK